MTTLWDDDLAVGQIGLDQEARYGLLLAEDDALKTYLEGVTVPEKGDMVPVETWFRFPEGERRKKYPFIVIDFLDIVPAYERWTSQYTVEADYCRYLDPRTGNEIRRGMYVPSTSPDLPDLSDPDVVGYQIDPPLMHVLTYQIGVYARSALHDRYLASKFLVDVFPPRQFFLPVDADMTWRRCQLLDMAQVDTMETTESGQKRVFTKVYTVSVDAEIPFSKVTEIYKVLRLHADIYPDITGDRESVDHADDDPHEIALDQFTVEAN